MSSRLSSSHGFLHLPALVRSFTLLLTELFLSHCCCCRYCSFTFVFALSCYCCCSCLCSLTFLLLVYSGCLFSLLPAFAFSCYCCCGWLCSLACMFLLFLWQLLLSHAVLLVMTVLSHVVLAAFALSH